MKPKRLDKIVICICVLALVLALLSIGARFFTKNVLIDRFEIDNAFTQLMCPDELEDDYYEVIQGLEAPEEFHVDINWAERYPFSDGKSVSVEPNTTVTFQNRYKAAVQDIKNIIESYSTNLLLFRSKLLECFASYEKAIGWNFASYSEYNGVVQLSDGHLTTFQSQKDVSEQADAIADFSNYCHDHGTDFLFVTAPWKISEYDVNISGKTDFSNQNSNKMNEQLLQNAVDCFDLRQTIVEKGLSTRSLFYRTDHHWRTTTAIWAAQQILEHCNDQYGWHSEAQKLELSNFDIEEYPDFFLGSHGKKVLLTRTEPDDFELLYPTFETKIHYCIPTKVIDCIGDYSVSYDYSALGNRNYYVDNPYGVCNYEDQPVVEIENLLYTEDKSIVILRDSYGDSMITGLALGVHYVYSLDIRYYTGSVRSYIEEKKPDLVIVMYHAASFGGKIDYSTHQDAFDFR